MHKLKSIILLHMILIFNTCLAMEKSKNALLQAQLKLLDHQVNNNISLAKSQEQSSSSGESSDSSTSEHEENSDSGSPEEPSELLGSPFESESEGFEPDFPAPEAQVMRRRPIKKQQQSKTISGTAQQSQAQRASNNEELCPCECTDCEKASLCGGCIATAIASFLIGKKVGGKGG